MNTPNNPDGRTGTLEVAGKAAVVTGAASGIGLAIVRELANAGAKVVAADLNEDVLSVFAKEPTKTGSLVQPILADVTVESDVERMIGECQSRFGQVDILINNAGLGGVVGSLTEISLKDWRDTFAVLVEGVLSGMKHAARAMISQGTGGSIVNMASVAGLNGGNRAPRIFLSKGCCDQHDAECSRRIGRQAHSRQRHLPRCDFHTDV